MKYFIFDVDGTLLNSAEVDQQCLQQMLREFGQEHTLEELRPSFGKPGRQTLADLGFSGEAAERAMDRWEGLSQERIAEVRVFNGVEAMLKALHERGCRCGIVTSRTHYQYGYGFSPLGLDGYFDAVICMEDAPRTKPAPDPLLCWLWLANTLGAGSSHAGRVLDVFGGAQEAWENRGSDAFRKAVGSPAFARANLPDNTPAHYRAFARRCAARNIRILPYDDPDYPLAFSRIPDMPLVLYCTGDPLWLNEPGAVGMVGSRRPTEYGLQAAADLGSGLAKNGAIIVSGLADGLDSAGHRAAVKENCPTIGVLGVPIDRTYPASNRELRKKIEQKGCVISEYPPESGPVGPNGFLQRNRLIAALSSALVVVEAQEKSGTMSTVNHAERYGKPVFVVPGSIYSPNSAGTNALLREGRAKAVCKPGDLSGVLGLRGAAAPAAVRSAPDPMSETERRVLACIGPKAKGVEELGAASGLPTGLLLGTLMKLELAGRVTCLPGKRYILR